MKRLFTVTGVSCSGKTTLVSELIKTGDFNKVITTTTRAPREGELHGRDYYFRSKPTVEAMINDGLFIEQVEFSGEYYGVEFAEIDRIFKADKTPIIIVDPRGVKSLKKEYMCYTIYVDGKMEDLYVRFLTRFKENLEKGTVDPVYEAKRLVSISKEHHNWWLDMDYEKAIMSFTSENKDAIVKGLVQQALFFRNNNDQG